MYCQSSKPNGEVNSTKSLKVNSNLDKHIIRDNLKKEKEEDQKTVLSSISMWLERWFSSSNAKNIGTLYLILVLFAGLVGTAYSVLIRLELSGPGVQFIADNQLYNSIITTHAIVMIFFMVMPAMIGGFGNFLLPLLVGGPNTKNNIVSSLSLLPAGKINLYTGFLAITILAGYMASCTWLEHCDSPRPWGVYFQDSATPQLEGLVELHDNIMFYLVIILFGVGWILVSIIKSYTNTGLAISHKYLNHGTSIELIWTITPAIILILIAFPSFKLLYLMDEVSDPAMSVLAEGHQWYWSYQYPDFLNSEEEFIEFDSYLVPESDLEDGALRMLEVDNRVIVPELTHVRFIVTGADVIHSFACPALGIKCDAYPGRLSQVSVLVNREGTFYGQCSEICGILHSSMPIVIESVSIEKFLAWLEEQ